MSKLKHFIKHLIPTLFFVYLTSLTWINLENLEIIILGISTIIIGFGLSKFMSGRTASVKIEQYKILLEYLSSRLSAGHTLESSLLEASERLADELGRKSTLAKCLKQLNQGMQAQLNLERCLRILKEQFNCKHK